MFKKTTYYLITLFLLSLIFISTAEASSTPAPANMISVKDYGATGNDTSDDTTSIQKAIDAAASAGKTLDFPVGSYYINPNTGLNLRNNSSLYFENGAKLISEATSNSTYFIVKIWGVNNVKMLGYPTIIGERTIHTGSGGESGMGIGIANSNSIYIENPTISNCWGDGIYIGDNGLSNHTNKDVTIENAVLDNNRRQGISVISAINLKIDNPKITNTNGTPPAAGIDFEPNYGYQFLQNITVTNPYIQGNDGHGIQFSIGLGPFDTPVSINVVNSSNVKNNEKHNYYGSASSEYNLWLGSSSKVKGQIMIDGKNYWLLGSPTVTNPTSTPSPSPTPTQPSNPIPSPSLTPVPSQPSNPLPTPNPAQPSNPIPLPSPTPTQPSNPIPTPTPAPVPTAPSNSDVNSQLQALENEISQLKQSNDTSNTNIESAKNKIASLQSQINKDENLNAQQKASYDKSIQSLNSKVSQQANQISTLQKIVDALQNAIDKLKALLAKLFH